MSSGGGALPGAARVAARAIVGPVPSDAFHRLVDDEPAFRSFVMAAMSGRLFELMATLEELATTTVLQRVATYLVRAARGRKVVPGTQTTIASELGTAREVVFRALRGLAARGLVAPVRGGVRILDGRGLADAATRSRNASASTALDRSNRPS
jgi:CRP/FNR family transcriptional regulator